MGQRPEELSGCDEKRSHDALTFPRREGIQP